MQKGSSWLLIFYSACTVAILCIGCSSLFSNESAGHDAAKSPIIYAHYMPTYVLGALPPRDLNDPGALEPPANHADAPASETGLRTWWSPRLADISRDGASAVLTDFALGQAAGLDAFGLLIGPKHLPHSAYSAGIELLALTATTTKVKLLPELWDNWDLDRAYPSREELLRYGASVKQLMDRHPTSFLRFDGKPVVSLGNPLRYPKSRKFSWNDYRHILDAWGGPDNVYIILNVLWHESDMPNAWLSAADAYSMWAATLGWNDPQLNVLTTLAKTYRKALAWPVSSSYYGGRKATESMAESLGISRFTDQWRMALRLSPRFIVVQSWNDFSEDHAITETNYRGTALIEMNRYFADWAHSGQPPKIENEKLYLFYHRQLVDAALPTSAIRAHNDAWHLTPTTDYLNVVALLSQPGTIRLKNGQQEWSILAPAGFTEWLIYVPSRKTAPGLKREAYTRAKGSYPDDSDFRRVTPTSVIFPDRPEVDLLRDGHSVLRIAGRTPIAASATWQDLSMVGTGGSQ